MYASFHDPAGFCVICYATYVEIEQIKIEHKNNEFHYTWSMCYGDVNA